MFRAGIDRQLLKLGYPGSLDDPLEKVRFLQDQFQKNEVPPVSNATLTNWITRMTKGGKPSSPSTKANGRENVFKLCFALEMNAVETAEFMLKSYLRRPFNYKNTDEAVYFYCLSNDRRYPDAQRILKSVACARKTIPDETIDTEQIGQELADLRNENDLIEYLAAHTYTKEQWHHSAQERIKKLLERCKELACQELPAVLPGEEPIRAAEIGNDALLNTIYGFKASVRPGDHGLSAHKNYDFPEVLKNNWIDKQALYNVVNGKGVSDEVYRKTLILLSFYSFYATLYVQESASEKERGFHYQSLADEFEDELDQLLAEAGYLQIYKRNPFDWFILYCAAFPDPLERFRDLIHHFRIDQNG